MKKAFTLAEIMIVFAVIGILTAILLPSAFHSVPDEDIVKFKKANTTLYRVINELVNSDKYYLNGDLSLKKDGTHAEKSTFCESFADVISAKSVSCDYETGYDGDGFLFAAECEDDVCHSITVDKESIDTTCQTAESSLLGDIGIKASDNVIYFEATLHDFFGCVYKQTCNYSQWNGAMYDDMSLYNGKQDLKLNTDIGIVTNRFYRYFCIDIDGINKGEAPFGYGIRVDGKIITGKNADEWIKKSIQQKD